jgi:hypothetical protein
MDRYSFFFFIILLSFFFQPVYAGDIYQFNFLFYKSGDVFLESVYHIDSVPETPMAGDYELRALSKDRSVLQNVSFKPMFFAFIDPLGPIDQDASYVEVSVPVIGEVDHYSILHNGKEVLFFRVEENCIDGIDNDLDGFIDCVDTDCSVTEACRSIVLFSDRAKMPLLIENSNRIIVRTTLINNFENSPFTDVLVHADISKPDGTVETIPLNAEDNEAEHSYSKEYADTKQEGYYRITYTATGKQNNESFTRRKEDIMRVQLSISQRILALAWIIPLVSIALIGIYLHRKRGH